MSGVNEIRSSFLQFFARNGHEIVPSSSLVPRNDPTLMFTNAGMVQFKNVFTGVERRPYHRAATAQKCVRAGGKHNDLDNVGYTARHHTFFEMLGNFSFGDYFKPLAIELAWTLITKEFGLPKDRLWVTVYHDDDDAFDLWKRIAGLPEFAHRAHRDLRQFLGDGRHRPLRPVLGNLLRPRRLDPRRPARLGATRTATASSRSGTSCSCSSRRCPAASGSALPRPSIDTGMGLERVAAVLQGKHDNYDIDLMRALIRASAEATGVDPDGPHKVSHRVIADHLRASVVPGRRRRAAVQRGARLRAAPHHAPRHAPRPASSARASR